MSSLGIALGLLGASALGYAGLGRERNGPTLTAGLGAAQLGLHYLFTVTCAAPHAAHRPHRGSRPHLAGADAAGLSAADAGGRISAAPLVHEWWRAER